MIYLLVALVASTFALTDGRQDQTNLAPPTIHPDGRVTFRYHAPDADKVVLSLETQATPIPLQKGDNAVWQVTTEILDSDIYAYYFFVDGMPAGDPSNKAQLPVITGGGQGLIHIPGKEKLPWERGEEAKGTLKTIEYDSKIIGEPRRMSIYLPPGYEDNSSEKYPTLYLLHGVMNDDQAWPTAGRVNVILDKLIQQSAARPMIVVMPNGYGFKNAKEEAKKLFGPINHNDWMEKFKDSVIDEIIPTVESRFRVRSTRETRAIAGLSMGAAQALQIGLNHPDRFATIGCMSGAFMMYGGKPEQFLGGIIKTPPQQLPKIWLTVGKQDFVFGANEQTRDWLESNNIEFTFEETAGGHTWQLWRRGLLKFAPTLFQEEKAGKR